MKTRIAFMLMLAVLATLIVSAQQRGGGGGGGGQQRGGPGGGGQARGNAPRANQGHVPPAPQARGNHRAKPEVERDHAGRRNNTPHVNNDRWYGNDRPNDRRYRIPHPFEHGRFERFGPSYRHEIDRFDRDHRRFWLPGGFFFEIAFWDWPICSDWCWDCGDDYTIYEDPDHVGWYLLYNIHTGVYVHVQYLGM